MRFGFLVFRGVGGFFLVFCRFRVIVFWMFFHSFFLFLGFSVNIIGNRLFFSWPASRLMFILYSHWQFLFFFCLYFFC